MLRTIRAFIDRWVFNRDLKESEREVLSLLADGQDGAARSWRRVAETRPHDEEVERKAREAALEQIRLTRMVKGVADLYSYGRGSDER